MHIVLLGDSIFDNGSYVSGKPAVIDQLRDRLSVGWQASLRAVDGNVIADVADQLTTLPPDASHLVVSAGGNDALAYSSVMASPVTTVSEALILLAEVRDRFGQDYFAMLNALKRTGLPVACCTIYEPRYAAPIERRASATALSLLNDCILRLARLCEIQVIELRDICDAEIDFANRIEPSSNGGEKIARAITAMFARQMR